MKDRKLTELTDRLREEVLLLYEHHYSHQEIVDLLQEPEIPQDLLDEVVIRICEGL